MFKIRYLQLIILLTAGLYMSQTFAQPANLVLENMTVSGSQYFQATNSITVGSNFTVTNTGDATMDAPSVNFKDNVFVVQGGKMLVIAQSTAVEVKSETPDVPTNYTLEQNYPNPFNPTTTIKYKIPVAVHVTIRIFDVLGKEIETLVNEEKPAGSYSITWNAANLPSGIYFYTLKAGNFVESKKMTLLK